MPCCACAPPPVVVLPLLLLLALLALLPPNKSAMIAFVIIILNPPPNTLATLDRHTVVTPGIVDVIKLDSDTRPCNVAEGTRRPCISIIDPTNGESNSSTAAVIADNVDNICIARACGCTTNSDEEDEEEDVDGVRYFVNVGNGAKRTMDNEHAVRKEV
jgi:hypothetical protein